MNSLFSAILPIFWGLVLFSILVFIHEGGHFLAARIFGMRVTEFFLGMPCRFNLSIKNKKRGTRFGVTPLLLGGYTRICGMDGELSSLSEKVFEAVACAGRVEIEKLSKDLNVSVDDVIRELTLLVDWASLEPYYNSSLGESPSQSSWPQAVQTVRRDANLLTAYDAGHDFSLPGSTEAGQIHKMPSGGVSELLRSEKSKIYQGKGFIARSLTLLAGPLFNIILGIVLIVSALSLSGINITSDLPQIGKVAEGSAAASSGILANDNIISIDGNDVSSWSDVQVEAKSALTQNKPFEIVLDRQGQRISTTIVPDGTDLIGIEPTVQTVHLNIFESTIASFKYLGAMGTYLLRLIQPAHTAEIVSQSSSVLGISVMASEAASQGLTSFVTLMAGISLSLGLMNLLPIPPLDGGKLIIEIAQLVIRKHISDKIQHAISYVGLGLILLLFVIVLHQDIVRYIFGG